MKGYDHDSYPYFNYEVMQRLFELAKARASTGIQRREDEGNPHGNPSTDVYRLMNKIIEGGRLEKKGDCSRVYSDSV